MQLSIQPTRTLQGEVTIPASKSHTIRAVLLAALAPGTSTLESPLFSDDTRAAIQACRSLGATITQQGTTLIIEGFGSSPRQPSAALDMLNSGTSTNLIIGMLAALGISAEITGDASLRSRPVAALARALTELGCRIEFLDKPGCPPLRMSGRITGSAVALDASKSSQYVSSLLLAAPLLAHDLAITVTNPSELPYIDLTLRWLDQQSIRYERRGYSSFTVFGGQAYTPFDKAIPADWSSAAFPLCAAAVTDSRVLLRGLDTEDVQGDKAIVGYLRAMGADISIVSDGLLVKGTALRGREIDINATPDALPALAVMGCYARGTTRLHNVAQARVKETDRIAVMARELDKMGAAVEELPDGLVIRHSSLAGTHLHGHHDHRVVMALSLAGLMARGTTVVDTAEAVSVTYPTYIESMQQLGATINSF
ncbi:3-phosphoshikimate 1-carboxyvinyltransferase [Thermodesulfobacteriota bacterium]